MKIFIAIIILLITGFLIFHFAKSEKEMEKPKILSGKDCFWVGGQDGGYWVEIVNFNSKDSIVANLFLDKSGDFFQKNTYVNNDSDMIKNTVVINLQTASNFISESQYQIVYNQKYYTYKKSGKQ